MDADRLIAERARRIDASGVRRIFNLGARLDDPINLSIGQPDFPVPDQMKQAAIDAIRADRNGYTPTQGTPDLLAGIGSWLREDVGWDATSVGAPEAGDTAMMVTSGTSGALSLLFLALLEPGDEVIFADPYFVAYPHMARMVGATPVICDTHPDFRMTAERVAPLISPRTKVVLCNSPSNPAGVVGTSEEAGDLLALCRERGVLLVADEIYDEFVYSESRTERSSSGAMRCPSAARVGGASEDMVLIRGFGKTYGVTGWRLGYAAGPRAILDQMAKLQQYTFVCAPAPLQAGVAASFRTDMSGLVAEYERRRDLVVERLSRVTEVATPGGAFYAFPKVPERLGVTATAFIERCIERNLLAIPGSVFSERDTHIRLSYATPIEKLEQGLDLLGSMMGG